MNLPPFASFKNQLMAISFSLMLLFLLLGFCGCDICLFSLTMFLLVLPTSFPLVFSKIRKLTVAGSPEEPTPESRYAQILSPEGEVIAEEHKEVQEECRELQGNEVVLRGEHPLLENDNAATESSTPNEDLDNLRCRPVEESDFLEDDIASGTADSHDLLSDDDSLIEIALEDEPNSDLQRELKRGFLPEFFPDFSAELLFRKHGQMELLAEINEEDNMIEIDIAIGKCSRFEIKA